MIYSRGSFTLLTLLSVFIFATNSATAQQASTLLTSNDKVSCEGIGVSDLADLLPPCDGQVDDAWIEEALRNILKKELSEELPWLPRRDFIIGKIVDGILSGTLESGSLMPDNIENLVNDLISSIDDIREFLKGLLLGKDCDEALLLLELLDQDLDKCISPLDLINAAQWLGGDSQAIIERLIERFVDREGITDLCESGLLPDYICNPKPETDRSPPRTGGEDRTEGCGIPWDGEGLPEDLQRAISAWIEGLFTPEEFGNLCTEGLLPPYICYPGGWVPEPTC